MFVSPAVILVGASVRPAAESAQRAGLKVIAVDFFGDVDCRRVAAEFHLLPRSDPEQEQLMRTLGQQFPGSPVVLVGGFQRDNYISETFGGPITRQARDPQRLRSIAEQAGIRFPETIEAARGTSADSISADSISAGLIGKARWLEKSRIGTGGLGVRWSETEPQNNSIARPATPESHETILQQWIAGRRFGLTFLANRVTSIFLGACRSLHTRRAEAPFVYGGSLGPLRMSPSNLQLANDLGQAFVQETEYAGLFNADVIVDRSGKVWLLEFNLRWTASSELIEAAMIRHRLLRAGESLFATAIRAQYGLPTSSPLLATLKQRIAEVNYTEVEQQPMLKKIVYASRPTVFDGVCFTKQLTTAMQIRDLPEPATKIGKDEPIVSLMVDWNRSHPSEIRGAVSSLTAR